MEATKIHEWSIAEQPAELWIVNGKLQIRHRGTIHNTDMPHIKGRWRRKTVDDGYNIDWVCSECGFKWGFDFVSFKFCPMCGCKMESEENNE